MCVDDTGDGSSCSRTGRPIDTQLGNKLFRDEDFATSDGGLVLDRYYQSIPHLAARGLYLDQPLGLANWRFGFQYEIHIPLVEATEKFFVLMTPDGVAQPFDKQDNGALILMSPSGTPAPHPVYKLEYLDVWPAADNMLSIINSKTRWRLTDPEGNVWLFESFKDPTWGSKYVKARPTKMTSQTGLVQTFTYAADGSLATLSDNRGKTATFTWAVANGVPRYISSISLPGGSKLTYAYEVAETIQSTPALIVTYRLKSASLLNAAGVVQDATSYDYGKAAFPYAITGIRDKDGALRWSADYNANGQAILSTGPLGVESTSVEYSANGDTFTRTLTNALGKKTVYRFEKIEFVDNTGRIVGVDGAASTNCPSSQASIGYGDNGFISSTIDEEGRTTNYVSDALGRFTQITEAVGTTSARATTITYHATFNAPSKVVEPKKTTDFVYNTLGQLTSRTETDTTNYTTPYATKGRTRTWTYGWTTTGLLTSVDGPIAGTGDTVKFTYSALGYLASITNELGQITTISAWNERGLPTTITDPNGVVSNFTYDSQGRVLSANLNPGAAQSLFGFAYDAVGNLTTLTLPGGATLKYTYDAASRPVTITNVRGETVTLGTNLLGDVTSSVIKTSTGTIAAQQTQAFDELGRIIKTIGAASETTKYGYDKVDNLKAVTDARGKVFAAAFDPLDRVIKATDPEAKSIQLAYDPSDNLTSFKDGRTLTTTRIVDGFGRVIQEVSPDKGTTSYWYDNADRVTKTLDADSQQTDYTYDAGGRLTKSAYLNAATETITYTYDAIVGGNNGLGRLTAVTEESGSSAYTYDAQGRVTKDAKVIKGKAYAVGYGYDANGKVTSISLPSGRTVAITRTADGLITAITTKASATAAAQTLVSGVTYKPFGPLAGLTYGNGLALTRTYDANYWLTGIKVAATGATRLDLSYGRNVNGQLTLVTDNASTGRGGSFAYTDSGRLNAATGPWGTDAYTYDGAGNRTGKTRTIGTTATQENVVLAATSNRITSVKDKAGVAFRTLTYRPGGDLSQDALTSGVTYAYTYNARKRLVGAKTNNVTTGAYGYDYAGRRVWRTITAGAVSTTANYVFDLAGHLIAEHDGATGTVVREYVWLDDMPIAVIDTPSTGAPKIYAIHTGQIDEPLVMTDAAKAKVWDAYVEPYGQAKVFGTPSAGLDIRLPGQFLEAESGGLHQNWFRNYDPTLGRYIEADPLGIDAGQNPYAYVDGDPLGEIDRQGLSGGPISPPPVPKAPTWLPGGPWSPAPGQRAGAYYGPAQPNGPRAQCQWVPSDTAGGPPGSRGYWKVKFPGQKGWQRYSAAGVRMTAEESHPGNRSLPKNIIMHSTKGGPIVAGVTTFVVVTFWPSPAY